MNNMFSFSSILESLILVIALSTDAFVASLAYGGSKIKIPFKSVQIINLICSFLLGLSLLLGSFIRQYIPDTVTTVLCFGLLFVLGSVKLLDSSLKSFIRRHNGIKKKLRFSISNLHFILHLYAAPEEADVDRSKVLSAGEAASLAVALSLDGLAVGFGAALGSANFIMVIVFSLLMSTVAIVLGCFIGTKLAEKIPFDFSIFGGLLLIILAFLKL